MEDRFQPFTKMSRFSTDGGKQDNRETKSNSSIQWLLQQGDSFRSNQALLGPERATRVLGARREDDYEMLHRLVVSSASAAVSGSTSHNVKSQENGHAEIQKLVLFGYQCVKGRRNYLCHILDVETLECVAPPQKLPFTICEGMAVCQLDSKVFFVGGKNPCSSCSQSWCVEYNALTNFTYFLQNFPAPIEYAGAAASKERLYVVGGKNLRGKIVNWVYSYDFSHNKWEKMPNMNHSRWNASVAYLNDCLYAVGVTDRPNYCTEQWRISPEQVWTIVDLPSFISIQTCKMFVCSDKMYMFARGKAARIYQYDTSRKKWKSREDFEDPPCISHIVCHNSTERKVSHIYAITDDFPDFKWHVDTWEWEATEGRDKCLYLSWLYCHLVY